MRVLRHSASLFHTRTSTLISCLKKALWSLSCKKKSWRLSHQIRPCTLHIKSVRVWLNAVTLMSKPAAAKGQTFTCRQIKCLVPPKTIIIYVPFQSLCTESVWNYLRNTKKKKKSNFKVLKGLIFSFQISLSKNLSERDLKTFYNNNLNNRFSVGSFVSATWMNMLMLCKCFTYTACGQL